MASDRAIVRHKAQPVKIGETIEIDSCLDESHTLQNVVTDHPVEQGSNISDHSRPEPDRVVLRCFVSDTPFSTNDTTRKVRQGDVTFETTAPRYTPDHGRKIFAKLEKMRLEGTLVQVVTTLKTYAVQEDRGMLIESIVIPRTRQNFAGLEFTMTLKEVRIVKNAQTSPQRVTTNVQRNAKGKKGKKNEVVYGPADLSSRLNNLDSENNNSISNFFSGVFGGGR